MFVSVPVILLESGIPNLLPSTVANFKDVLFYSPYTPFQNHQTQIPQTDLSLLWTVIALICISGLFAFYGEVRAYVKDKQNNSKMHSNPFQDASLGAMVRRSPSKAA